MIKKLNSKQSKIKFSKMFIITTSVLSVLLAAATTISVIMILKNSDKDSAIAVFKSTEEELENIKSENEKTISELEAKLADMTAQRDSIEKELEDLKKASAETELLTAELENKNSQIKRLQEQIESMKKEAKFDLEKLNSVLIELNTMLTSEAPKRTIISEETAQDGTVGKTESQVYPNISLYYEDLTTGYKYIYNGDAVYYSASCIKAPLALSILTAAEEEDIAIKERVENGAVESEENESRIFKLDKIFTYTSIYAMDGTGIIKNSADGTEYTYLELIKYMLTYSDNVAFSQILKEWGYSYLRELVAETGATVMQESLWNSSAVDGGKMMKKIYEYIEGNHKYSSFIKDAMMSSEYKSIIPAGVHGKDVVHKYGWDINAYHDMGIVYDENPYIIVFMSDMDTGDKEVTQYVQKVISLIDSMHEMIK